MSRQCEIVQDLLPLYVDEICSPGSREMIAEHIASCEECAGVLRQLKNTEIENELISEKTDVLQKQEKLFKRKSALAGFIIGMIMLIPVITVFIVTVATGNSARGLFIVISGILLAASLIVAPLVFPRNKFLWTVALGTVFLMLLLAVAISSKWFFVAATATLFGLSVILGPIIVNHKAVKSRLGNNKALIVMGASTILFALMMLSIGLATGSHSFFAYGSRISAIMVALCWLYFVVIRYIKTNGLVKAGICCIITGAFIFSVNTVLGALVGYSLGWPVMDLLTWNAFTVDGNVKWLCLLAGAVIGLILIIIGLIKGGKRK